MAVKWSPMEIQEMRFTLIRKGFDPEEVRSFLMSMAEQVEILIKEREEMKRELDYAREELAGHKRREQILKETLLTAQQVAGDIKKQAERQGEIVVKEAELKAQSLYQEGVRKITEVEQQVRELKAQRHRLILEVEQTLQRFQKYLKEERDRDKVREAELSAFLREKQS